MDKFLSKALVEEGGLGKTIFAVREQFALIEFLDFCSFLESIVLNDKLVMVSQYKKEQFQEEDAIPGKKNRRFTGHDDIFDFLEENGVLEREWVRPPSYNSPDKPTRDINVRERQLLNDLSYLRNNRASFSQRRRKVRSVDTIIEDSWYESQRILNAEEKLNISPLSFLRQQPYYINEGRIREKHTYCDLLAQYNDLSKALTESRLEFSQNFSDYIVLPVPPVALLLLQRAKNPGDLLNTAMEMRDEFGKLRENLTEIRSVLGDPSVPPLKKNKLRKSWLKSWSTLDKYKNFENYVYLADTTQGYFNVDKSLDGIGIDSVSFSKVLGRIIQIGEQEFYKWRIRILHSTTKKYLKTSNVEINSHLRRLYRYEINQSDVEILKQLGFLD